MRSLMPPIIRKFYPLIALVSISSQGLAEKAVKPDMLIKEAVNTPLAQISALAQYEEINSKNFTVFALGDQASSFRTLTWKKGRRLVTGKGFSFAEIMLERFSTCLASANPLCQRLSKILNSDWEAMQIDGHGRRFMLQEHSGLVLALSKTNEYLADFRLDYEPVHRAYAKKTNLKSDGKAAGEGLVLMSGGHFLVLHQRNPAAIVEYGPAGDKALGIHRDNFLTRTESFRLPAGGGPRYRYHALKVWGISGLGQCDLNELTYDFRKARLMTLSKRCQKVYSFANAVSSDVSEVKFEHEWQIPAAIKEVEGMVVLANGQWLLASDLREEDVDNVFLVAPLIK